MTLLFLVRPNTIAREKMRAHAGVGSGCGLRCADEDDGNGRGEQVISGPGPWAPGAGFASRFAHAQVGLNSG